MTASPGPARTPRSDAGLSLPEVLVAMALTSILLAALAGIFASDLRTTSRISAKVTATADARLAVDTMSRRLRVAVAPTDAATAAFTVTGARSVTFYASLVGAAAGGVTTRATEPTPTKVEYSVVPVTSSGQSTECLREVLTPAVKVADLFTYPASGSTTRCLAYGAFNIDGTALFTYFQSGSGTAQTAVKDDVRSVGIALSIAATAGGQRAATAAATRVTCPNVRARGTT